MKIDNKILGKNIKKYRNNEGLTQAGLAKKIGKSTITVRKYEAGDVSIPLEVLQFIAETFDITIADLLVTDEEIEELVRVINNNISLSVQQKKQLMNLIEEGNFTWAQKNYNVYVGKLDPTKDENYIKLRNHLSNLTDDEIGENISFAKANSMMDDINPLLSICGYHSHFKRDDEDIENIYVSITDHFAQKEFFRLSVEEFLEFSNRIIWNVKNEIEFIKNK